MASTRSSAVISSRHKTSIVSDERPPPVTRRRWVLRSTTSTDCPSSSSSQRGRRAWAASDGDRDMPSTRRRASNSNKLRLGPRLLCCRPLSTDQTRHACHQQQQQQLIAASVDCHANELAPQQAFLSVAALHVVVISAALTSWPTVDLDAACDLTRQYYTSCPQTRSSAARPALPPLWCCRLFAPDASHQPLVKQLKRPTRSSMLCCSSPSRYAPHAPTDHASFPRYSSLTAEVNGLPGAQHPTRRWWRREGDLAGMPAWLSAVQWSTSTPINRQ